MKVYLSSVLLEHRRGRFLASLLDAEQYNEHLCPNAGILLLTGEQFQDSGNHQQDYLSWARQPGCAVLFLPPYKEGRISDSLDWMIGFSSGSLTSIQNAPLPAIIAPEVVYTIEGNDGSSESTAGHQWSNHSVNTRYWKAHVNSGLVAATTLPLWSISLMDHADLTREWLSWLYSQTGKRSSLNEVSSVEEATCIITPHDYTVLVCCYGLNVTSPSALSESIRLSIVPIVNLTGFDLPGSFDRLKSCGLLDENGLTTEGLANLRSTQYWPFAKHLKGAA